MSEFDEDPPRPPEFSEQKWRDMLQFERLRVQVTMMRQFKGLVKYPTAERDYEELQKRVSYEEWQIAWRAINKHNEWRKQEQSKQESREERWLHTLEHM